MSASTSHPARWDLFCRVVDNFGDIGVSWRLACDLASRGHPVRLWVDDPAPLVWMAPRGQPGVELIHWSAEPPDLEPADCVVETFGCDPPPRFVERMVRAARAPVWINLEYLSAEPYVERSHGLPSPQLAGPGLGLTKWFFYPGLSPRTGGLMREPGLLEPRAAFDRDAWLAGHGLARRPDEQVVSLFCYANAGLPALLERLAQRPTLLLVTPGHAAQAMADNPVPAALAAQGLLRAIELPPLPQTEFDRLLWACDLNFVRGEDSFVRAQWAGAPFVWQIYPQLDGVHARKLEAFLDAYLAGAAPQLRADVRDIWAGWNGLTRWSGHWPAGPAWAAWREHAASWSRRLADAPDLTTRLIRFVQRKR